MSLLTTLAVRLWGAALAIGCIALAWSSLQVEIASAPYRAVVTRLETGEPVPSDDLSARRAAFAAQNGASSCRPDVVHAAIGLDLAQIDRKAQERDRTGITAALQAGRGTMKAALACDPSDGNAWLRLAMIEGALSRSPQTTDRPMALSTLFAPAEAPVLAARMSYWTAWTLIPPGPAEAALARDVDVVAAWVRPVDAVGMLAAVPKVAARLVTSAVARQPDIRQADLRQAGYLEP